MALFPFFSIKIGLSHTDEMIGAKSGRGEIMAEGRKIFEDCFGMNRILTLICVSLLLSSCQAKPTLVKPRLENEGAVYVYLRPYPQEADRLTFRIEGIFATRKDGGSIPLSLFVKEFHGREFGRERLLAVGELPPGQYEGLSLQVKSASLKGEEGEIALRSGEEGSRISIPFSVVRRKAVVLSLQFRYRESVLEGFRFSPSFSATIPGKIPTGMIGLVTSRGSNIITMFDKITGRIVGIIPTGASPSGIALDPVLRKAYIAISGEDALEVVDLLEGAVMDRQRLTAGDNPLELALTLDGKTLLSANSGSNTVSIIDAASMTERNRFQVGAGPQSILIDRNGRRAYIFNALGNTISVVDIGMGAVAATVVTEAGPVRGQFNRAGNRLYVMHRDSPYLSVIDPVSLSIVRRVNTGTGGAALKVDQGTDLIYIAKRFGEEIDIFDPFSFLPIDYLKAGGEPSYLTIDGEGNRLLIVLPGEGRLRIVNLVGKVINAEIDLGDDPFHAAVMGEK